MIILISFLYLSCSSKTKKQHLDLNRNMPVEKESSSLKLIYLPQGVQSKNEINLDYCECKTDTLFQVIDSENDLRYYRREYTFDTLIGHMDYSFCYSNISFTLDDSDTLISIIFSPYLDLFRKSKA